MSYRDILGFSIAPLMQRVMNINGFFASIMRSEKKAEGSGEGLPPGVPIPVLPVDYLKVRPDSWIGGEGSYVVPVDSEWGLWFNWTMNNPANTAILASVKGMNPLTGTRVNGLGLEDYEECPVHKKPFSKDRLCAECGFKWPHQNYLSGKNQWLDGFRTPDGHVRQFYFTEEMSKSIPELVIGKEDTVPAFGFAFYKLKKYDPNWEKSNHIKEEFPRECRTFSNFNVGGFPGVKYGSIPAVYTNNIVYDDLVAGSCDSHIYLNSCNTSAFSSSVDNGSTKGRSKASRSLRGGSVKMCKSGGYITPDSASYGKLVPDSASPTLDGMIQPDMGALNVAQELGEMEVKTSGGIIIPPMRKSAEVGVGAGAKIKQQFNKSKNSVEDWQDKPAGVIRLYFVFQEEFEKYASAGFKNLEGTKEGYLENLPVGGR